MVMTRDLIRAVLEAAEMSTGDACLQIDGELIKPGSDAEHAAFYCLERQYIVLTDKTADLVPRHWVVRRLTADGHDKLRSLRGETPL